MLDTAPVPSGGNRWLESLPKEDRARLEPELRQMTFERARTLFDCGENVDHVWFPLSGVVSMVTVLDDGQMVETAAIGREGMVGITCGPLNGRAVSRAIAQTDGTALCVDAGRFERVLAASPGMRSAVARYSEALFAQIQQTAACNALHKLDARLARWLLMLHDRVQGDVFLITQESLAEMLGVRRATVNEVIGVLEQKGAVRHSRGRIEIVNRRALEGASCECYRDIRRALGELDADPRG